MKQHFPRSFVRQRVKYQLLLWRKIPDRLPVAIYQGPPTLTKGQLVADLIVVDPELNLLEPAQSLKHALEALNEHQHKLRRLRRLSNPAPSHERVTALASPLPEIS